MTVSRDNYFSGMPLSRDEALRRDTAMVEQLRAHPQTRVLAVWRSQHLITDRAAPAPVWHTGAEASQLFAEATGWVLLGMRGEAAHFAVDVSHMEDPVTARPFAGRGEFADIRNIGPLMARDDGSIMAYARGLMYWHSRHRFCGVCGSPTESTQGGHVRRCTDADCGVTHFPRTDPAVIMLVTYGDQCLLGRQRSWPAGMHSTLAGFVEQGESLEEAVMREIKEESGVDVERPIYHSSQPWPFPSSIMLGFRAEARSPDIVVDTEELETAAWFHRDQLLDSPENSTFRLPRKISIARRLIDDWLFDRND